MTAREAETRAEVEAGEIERLEAEIEDLERREYRETEDGNEHHRRAQNLAHQRFRLKERLATLRGEKP